MIKKKVLLIFVGIFLLGSNACNMSFSAENSRTDYAYELVGEDSWEGFNRKIFIFNLKANKYLIRPINVVWASIMPQYGMDRIHSFYKNANYPVRLAGCLLQKDFQSTKSETVRFLTNTILGIGGLYDVALLKFKIEPHEEDIEQALAQFNIKKGPFLVVPIVALGNVRDIAGQVLDLPLNPTSYIIGPVAIASTGVSWLNKSAYWQPIFKVAENYPDPYVVAKQAYGIERYIKNNNLDRKEVFLEKLASQNIVPTSSSQQNPELKADILLNDYNPQNSEIDAMRSMWFDKLAQKDSVWSELSVWNKSFDKKLKTSYVSLDSARPKYKYRYILQKCKSAPLAIIYTSLGEGVTATQPMVQAKFLYDEGYSVIITSNPFNWEFINSMPGNYKPALPPKDAHTLRVITYKIIDNLQNKYKYCFDKKLVVGNSYGALTTLFVAAQEAEYNTLGISKYIAINPPIEYFYSLKKLDKYGRDSQNSSGDTKLRAAMTAQKVLQFAQNPSSKILPFTEDEANLAIGYSMKQKLSDVVFTIENGAKLKTVAEKRALYEKISTMGYYDYALQYLIKDPNKTLEQVNHEASLYSLSAFFKNNNNYKIYHSIDDCFVTSEQLIWLKEQSEEKSVFFSNGSHFGALYRKEFLDQFQKDIQIEEMKPQEKL